MSGSGGHPVSARSVVIWPVLLLGACLFTWGSLLTFDPGDWPSPLQFPHNNPSSNCCGLGGAFLSYHLFYYLGDGAYVLTLFATFAGWMWLLYGKIPHLVQRAVGLALLIPAVAASVHLISGGGSLPEGHGGVLGMGLGEFVKANFNHWGAIVVLGYALFVGLIFVSEGWVLRLPGAIGRIGRASAGRIGPAIAAARGAAGALRIPQTVAVEAQSPFSQTAAKKGTVLEAVDRNREAVAVIPENRRAADKKRKSGEDTSDGEMPVNAATAESAPGENRCHPIDTAPVAERGHPTEEPAEEVHAPSPPDPAAEPKALSAAVRAPLIIKHFERKAPPAPAEAYPREIEDWVFPPPSLLSEPEYSFSKQQESVVRAKAKTLERTLEEFRLEARVVEIDTGPVITMYELDLAPGIKVSQIASLSNDIARALKAPAVRVVAPIPGKNTVGIEVPNAEKEKVRLKELITMTGHKATKMALPLFIGKDASGAALVGDLAAMPHLLIAGTTGSGKSVCINSIIASILMTQRPDWCKLILIDPKMVEMAQFKDVPHLMCPIVTDMQKAESILEWAVGKMEERYALLSEARVRNIAGYNALGKEKVYERFAPDNDEEKAQIPTHLPYVVIVIDELADLMMTHGKELEHQLSRLAQKSRAVGIHIVVATQRPEAKVVTGLIKSNLPCRIAFRVASRMDSRIVLDQNGAEVLMGQGDMLFLPPGSAKLMRSQGTYLDDEELHAMIDFLTERAKPEFHPELIRLNKTDAGNLAERDPLFDQAVRVVLQSKRGSVSLLQRKLTVGYSRASRLIEQMSEAGIVGDYKGSQAREVNMTLEEWDALHAQMTKELEEGYAADADDDHDESEGEDD